MEVTFMLTSFESLCAMKMKLGQILVCCMTKTCLNGGVWKLGQGSFMISLK